MILLKLGIDIVSTSIINALESRINLHHFYIALECFHNRVLEIFSILHVDVFIIEFVLCIICMNIR